MKYLVRFKNQEIICRIKSQQDDQIVFQCTDGTFPNNEFPYDHFISKKENIVGSFTPTKPVVKVRFAYDNIYGNQLQHLYASKAFDFWNTFLILNHHLEAQVYDGIVDYGDIVIHCSPNVVHGKPDSFAEYFKIKTNGGINIVSTMDKNNFEFVHGLVNNNLIDKVLVYDKQYKNEFKDKTKVVDYIINSEIYAPSMPLDFKVRDTCYMGHMNEYRKSKLDKDIDVLSSGNRSIFSIIRDASMYRYGVVFDDGYYGKNRTMIHHNKAKALEYLMLGVRPLCEDGINSLSYNHLLNKKEHVSHNEYGEIYHINNENIKKFINAII